MSAFVTLAPLLFLAFGGLAIMLADAFSEGDSDIAGLAAAVLGLTGLASVILLVRNVGGPVPEFVSQYLATDPMAYFIDAVVCGGAALSALLAGGYNREHHDNRGEFHVVLLFSAFGAMVLGRAADLLTLFLGLETMSLGVYCLVGFRRTSERSAEGAIKYFLLGSFAAAILLFGCATLYGATGHTDLAGIGAAIKGGSADPVLVSFSLITLIVGLAFKVSAVPFHQWTPDAYEGAATPATTFMAVAVKSAAFAVLVRVLVIGFGDKVSMDPSAGWPPLLAGIAAITMVYGNIAAVNQTSVKRMLAYSSIAHAGYILVALVAVFRMGSEAISAVLFYLAAYTISNVLAFGSLILVGSHGKEAVSYEDLAGVGRRNPAVAIPFLVGILSLMGFPPTAGFFAKYYVFNVAVQAGGNMVWLAVLGVLSSAVGAYYYLRVLVFMFMKEPQAGAPVAVPMRSAYVVTAIALAGVLVMVVGLAPSAVLELAVRAAQKLLPA